MALFKNAAMTAKGLALLAKAQAGTQIKFTKMQVGSGRIDTQNPLNLLALLDPKLDVPITSISANPEKRNAAIVGNITNENIAEPLYICELGIFANDPDEGEILYGYVSAGDTGDYYAPASQGPYSWQYQIVVAVGNASNITAELSKLMYDYGVMNSNTSFICISGGNQKEINKSIDNILASQKADIVNLNIKLNNYSSYASGVDANGIYTVVDYKRTDGTIYMKSTLSNVDLNENYQTDTWQFYDADGITLLKTITWTLSYDKDSNIVSKVVV